ncbi:MAG: rhodanese-like domain-containing protein [Pseudomonadales bacterium]
MAIKNIFEEVKRLSGEIENLTVDDLLNEQRTNPELLLLDLRELQERVDLGTIAGSKHVPRGMLEFWADPASPYYRDFFAEDKRIVVFCAGGGRSVFATLALKDMGYRDVAHVADGFRGWKERGQPVEQLAATSRWIRRPE